MRLLFDQNISFRILRLLPESFSESKHVRAVGLNDHDDIEIWEFARNNNFTIVTFDADFFDFSVVKGFPPKVIWLRTGNLITTEIADRIISNYTVITSFITDSEQSCLEIY